MSVTTKTGDDGCTDIIGGRRLKKNHPVVECLGTIDELDAFLGDAKFAAGGTRAAAIIEGIQKDLYALMGILAGAPALAGEIGGDRLGGDRLGSLIKELEAQLPPFTSFAIPGANAVSAKLHIARTVCRRAERRMVGLGLDAETEGAVVPYINRLSDVLFLLAQREAGA